jgi:cellulose synthase operon protein C
MRYVHPPYLRPLLPATLLLALCAPGHADNGDGIQQSRQTDSRVRQQKQRPANVLRQDQPEDATLRDDQRPNNVVGADALPGNVVTTDGQHGNVLRLNEAAARASHVTPPKPVSTAAASTAAASTAPAAAPARRAPEEAPLWRMLDKRRYAALLARIDRLRADYPQWRPPVRLVSLAREGMLRDRAQHAIDSGDTAGLIALAHEQPAAFGCGNIVYAWALSEAHAKLNQPADAEAVARSLLACPKEDDRIATLYKAKAWLPPGPWEQLVTLEQRSPHSAQGEQRIRQLCYDYRVEQLIGASNGKEYEKATGLLAVLAPEIDARKDAATALLGAWSQYQLQKYDDAAAWFERALAWNPASDDARRGLALCAYQQKRYDAALAQAKAMSDRAEGRRDLMRDILVAQAQAAYTAGRHAQSLELLVTAQTQSSLPRHAGLLIAWNHMELGETDMAADEFSRLYREAPDVESAQGAFTALTRAGRDDDLKQLAQSEPLAGLVRGYHADRAFAEKRFLAARALAPERYAAAPQLALFAATRSKSGDSGTSQLEVQWKPSVEAALPAGRMDEVRLRVDRVSLDSGALPDNAQVGNVPTTATAYTVAPLTHMQGWQPKLSWRDERMHAWNIDLGLTPSGGAVASAWTGRIEYQRDNATTHLELSTYRDSVRESLLSYTGLRDPYQGGNWGRVLKNGMQGVLRTRLNERWSLNTQAGLESLSGEQVADNNRAFAEIGMAYDFRLSGFDYVVAGADAGFDHYDKNLSHFTTGHGGYFSPQHYWRAGPFLDFRTAENRPWMVRGRVSAGRSGRTEDETPLFPLNPDGRIYAATSGTGSAYDIEVAGVWRLSAAMQVGVQLAKRNSPQYSDYAATGFLRILFEPRKSVLSRDLPTSAAKDLF